MPIALTNLGQVRRLIEAAKAHGGEAKLRAGFERTLIASVGPAVSGELAAHGLRTDISPADDAYFMASADLGDGCGARSSGRREQQRGESPAQGRPAAAVIDMRIVDATSPNSKKKQQGQVSPRTRSQRAVSAIRAAFRRSRHSASETTASSGLSDLLTSWAFEIETLVLGWYILVETGSVLLLTVLASLQYVGTLIAPVLGMVGDRFGHRDLLAVLRLVYTALSATIDGAGADRDICRRSR